MITPTPTVVRPVALAALAGLLSLTHPMLMAEARSGPEAAREQLKAMATPAGLEVTLFASEPMMVNPADMDVDARGRVWITEGANYRISPRMNRSWGLLRQGGDRILILEDTRKTGAADKATTFYQDPSVNTALGVCVLGNRVIVSCSPYVFVLTDTNGDDVADKREILFEDGGQGDHDHDLHAFVFGPDGKLYFNCGNDSPKLLRPVGLTEVPLHGPIPAHQTQPVVDLDGNEVNNKSNPYRQGMVFRCNPDGSDVETLAWNFRNNYEVSVDSFGTLWQSDNDDDGNRGVRINFVMEYGNYGYTDEATGASWGTIWKKAQAKGAPESERPSYHWHQSDPGVVPNLLQTGNGSPTGICVYEGHLLPAAFQNQVLHCDAGPRVVRAYPVEPYGAGYKAGIENLLTSSDTWYRPSDVAVAPDGSVYIADWNDAGVGGHDMADRKLETMTGRVYRVAPPGHKPSVPKLDLNSPAGAAAALQSPNVATRYLAWNALKNFGIKAEKPLLSAWSGKDPRQRARALQLLSRLPEKGPEYVGAALRDSDADIRITGLRIARALKLNVMENAKMLATDPSPAVRREVAIAIRHSADPAAPAIWNTLASQYDGSDRWYLEALGIAADRQWDAFFDAWLAGVGEKWNTPVNREIVWRSRSKKTPGLLVKLIQEKTTSAVDRDRYLRSLDFMKGPEKEAALLQLITGN